MCVSPLHTQLALLAAFFSVIIMMYMYTRESIKLAVICTVHVYMYMHVVVTL